MSPVKVKCLGQAGLRLQCQETVVYCDPYLSDSVEALDGPIHRRMVPAPMAPADVKDADWVLVSHEHLDHFDPDTLVPIAKASPRAKFLVPGCVSEELAARGVDRVRITIARPRWHPAGTGVRIHPVPACHPTIERDERGDLRYLGYVIDVNGKRLYVAGDTSPHQGIVDAIEAIGGAHVGFIPINERNVYKERRGIVGNMSAREAFAFAEELQVKTLVPIHWDMFQTNCVFPEEVESLYARLRPPFQLKFRPESV